MSNEYYLIDLKRQEYYELGQTFNFKHFEAFNSYTTQKALPKYINIAKTCISLWLDRFVNDTPKETTDNIQYILAFTKDIYDWIMQEPNNNYICVSTEEFNKLIEETIDPDCKMKWYSFCSYRDKYFKKIGSRYLESNVPYSS
jgi:hypothetical protein